MKIHWGRVFRLTLAGVLGAVLLLDFSLAWVYIRRLTHPGCPQAVALPLLDAPVEEFRLEASDGVRVRAWYYPARNGAAIIAMGGISGALGPNLPDIEPLVRAGFGVLQIDTRACSKPTAPVTLGYSEALDAAAGFASLANRPEIAPGQIGIIGFSMGGVAALRAAARHTGITAVVAEGGYHNLGEDFVDADRRVPLPQRFFLYTVALNFWMQTSVNPWQSSPVDDLALISPRPVFLIYGEHEIVAGRAAAQFAAAKEPKELWIVPGGSHGRNKLVAPLEYEQRILDFFQRYLLDSEM